MIYKTFLDFKENVAPLPHRLLGLDVGTKTVGVAVSNSNATIASSLKTLTTKNNVFKDLEKILQEYEAKSFIVGYPLHMNGDAGEKCIYVEKFSEKLTEYFNLPVLLWDERMSTMSAERILLEADVSRNKRKKHIDAMAAGIILQSFLDFLKHHI